MLLSRNTSGSNQDTGLERVWGGLTVDPAVVIAAVGPVVPWTGGLVDWWSRGLVALWTGAPVDHVCVCV